MIHVTRTYLPDQDEYLSILKRAWDKRWITNNGELLQELELKLKSYLGLDHLMFCTNGTIVLQMALKAMGKTGEVITTPFSYVATTNAILWEQNEPVFVDIHPSDFNIDASKIEQAITEKTVAILVTHVYGNPCDVLQIEQIAKRYNLLVIYDGAHAFGVTYQGKSLFSFGDMVTCSFHATKLFHTVEGGALVVNNQEFREKTYLYRQFGHIYDDYYSEGINGKNSEFHAAMGLAILPKMTEILAARKEIFAWYEAGLKGLNISKPEPRAGTVINYSYYPVLFESEEVLLSVIDALKRQEIFGRRYFYPSLNTLPFLKTHQDCPVSEDISSRVYCLPLYPGLMRSEIDLICSVIQQTIK
jgi:dTDP-4-amino-4,6-dideoxygalactose transaminase